MRNRKKQTKLTTDEAALPKFLNSGEVADLLGVSERTVFTLRKEQGLPYIPVRNSIRYSHSAVIAWAAARQRVDGKE